MSVLGYRCFGYAFVLSIMLHEELARFQTMEDWNAAKARLDVARRALTAANGHKLARRLKADSNSLCHFVTRVVQISVNL